MDAVIRILIVEDRPNDAALMMRELRRAGHEPVWTRVDTELDYLAQLDQGWDLILSDYSLPQFSGLRALELLKARGLDIPFIVVSGTIGEDQAVEAMKVGASDYVMKDRLGRLDTAIERALQAAVLRREQHQAETALGDRQARYEAMVRSINDGVISCDHQGRVVGWNPGAEKILGYSEREVLNQPFVQLIPDRYQADHLAGMARVGEGGASHIMGKAVELQARHKDGREIPISLSLSQWQVGEAKCFTGIIRDLSERKLAETEREQLETQLRMSQKMEAIGRLAAGVAHDFNNLLTVILGYTEFALHRAPEGSSLREDLAEVNQAADRGAMLTRQLLAFSRKEVLQPTLVDLNQTVAAFDKTFRLLLGEDINFVLRLAPDLGLTMADPSQIEQVIMNLVINARDAMPRGGTLVIESADIEIDDAYAANHAGVQPGSYVQLAISDTGCGMDAGTKAHVFEPFFTTKEQGKGTGLGLSTVYGIVKQSGGGVVVYSELGVGTTFRIYLRREGSAVAVTAAPTKVQERPPGNETILLVEDEEAIRKFAKRCLDGAGYRVVTAGDGEEALEVLTEHVGNVDLVVTDVVMPRMSGGVLAQKLSETRPALKILFVSGYTDAAILQHGVQHAGSRFLSKPFSPAGLLRKVREVLDDAIPNGLQERPDSLA